MIGIYYLENPEGKVYVGQSRNIESRFNNYKNLNCKGQPKLYDSLKKFGFDNHYKTVLEVCKLSQLNERERFWQDEYNVLEEGLNIKLQSTHRIPALISEDLRRTYRKAAKKRGNSRPVGSYRHSEETIEKIRTSNTGQKRSYSSKKKISMANKGKTLEDTHKQAISAGVSCPVKVWDLNGNCIAEFSKIGELIQWIREEKGSCSDFHIRQVLKGQRDSYKRMRFTSDKWDDRYL
mgnify:CR=1 FL=1